MQTTDTDPAHFRINIRVGSVVDVIRKKDRPFGTRTRGEVKLLLTGKPYHSRGIKVQLTNRLIGRVVEIISP